MVELDGGHSKWRLWHPSSSFLVYLPIVLFLCSFFGFRFAEIFYKNSIHPTTNKLQNIAKAKTIKNIKMRKGADELFSVATVRTNFPCAPLSHFWWCRSGVHFKVHQQPGFNRRGMQGIMLKLANKSKIAAYAKPTVSVYNALQSLFSFCHYSPASMAKEVPTPVPYSLNIPRSEKTVPTKRKTPRVVFC